MRRLALAVGPGLFVSTLLVPPPAALALPAWHVAGLAAWMAAWWLTAVVPLEATSLLPIVILPLAGTRTLREVTSSYADPVIFLFLGGFLLAATLERWDLHKRFAVGTIRRVGADAPRVVLAFMLASAALSMWISNTATAVMMLPIALALVGSKGESGGFPTALMLGIAYACSIGGVATLIGTPPNAILAGAVAELAHTEITFAGWMVLGFPIAVTMLFACWWLLVRMFRVRGEVSGLKAMLGAESTGGTLSGGERFVLSVFGLTAASWIMRAPKTIGDLRIPGLTDLIPGISDAAIAIGAALLLFVIPLKNSRFDTALDWESARKIPWGVLLLFGGGLALAGAFGSSGLSDWVGGRLIGLRGAPFVLVVLATTVVFVLLTELTSNTATAALGMPLMVGVAQGLGEPALPLMAAAALGASMAFMLPVATPPNAILFGSGVVRSRDMALAGAGLNALSICIITVVIWIWA
ncbi:MAG: SLC13 family permease [Gemmatimonadales bacterium]